MVNLSIRDTAGFYAIRVDSQVYHPVGVGTAPLYAALPTTARSTTRGARFGLAPNTEQDEMDYRFRWTKGYEHSVTHDNFTGNVYLSNQVVYSSETYLVGDIPGRETIEVPVNKVGRAGPLFGEGFTYTFSNGYRFANIPCESSETCSVAVVVWHRSTGHSREYWRIVSVIHSTGRYYCSPIRECPDYESEPWYLALETYWTPEDCALLGGDNGYATSQTATIKFGAIPDRKECLEHLKTIRQAVLDGFTLDSEVEEFGELTCQAVSGLRATSANTFTTTAEAVEMTAGIRDLISIFASVGRPGTWPEKLKSLVNLRLSLKWGAPLTYRDLADIGRAIGEYTASFAAPNAEHALRARGSHVIHGKGALTGYDATLTRSLKLVLRHKPSETTTDIVEKCWEFNFGSAASLWDAIPYSFVVDWFCRIGDVLEDIDSFNALVAFYDVVGSVMGTRLEVDIDTPFLERLGIPWQGNLNVVLYKRRAIPLYYPLPTVRVRRGHFGQTQEFDALSLIIQRF